MNRVPCLGSTHLFFIEHARGRTLERARAICATCPFPSFFACLEGAVERGEEHGVWAGTSRNERRTLARRWSRADWTLIYVLRAEARRESAALREELLAA